MRSIILIVLLSLTTSCCIYKETRHYSDRDICEIGISGFNQRPIAQDDCEVNR